MNIYYSKETRDNITKIKKEICDDYDSKRTDPKPWKYTGLAFKKIYYRYDFVNREPTDMYYNGELVGKAYTKRKSNEDYYWGMGFFPEYNSFLKYNPHITDYYIKVHCLSDGCLYTEDATLYNMNGEELETFHYEC